MWIAIQSLSCGPSHNGNMSSAPDDGAPLASVERSHTSEDKEQIVMVSTFPSHLARDTADQCAYLSFGCCDGHLTGLLDVPFSVLLHARPNFVHPQPKAFSGGSPLLINSSKLSPRNHRLSTLLAHHALHRPPHCQTVFPRVP